ncbi:hypothetical protein BH10ACI1_BH10ACI1_24850 [soil metagenome]
MLKRKKTMESLSNENNCPKCGALKMKSWDELDFEQKFLIERLPASADFTLPERKKHRFCSKCFYEEIQTPETKA